MNPIRIRIEQSNGRWFLQTSPPYIGKPGIAFPTAESAYTVAADLTRSLNSGRYTITTDDDDSVFIGGEKAPVYLGQIEDDERLLELQAEDRAAGVVAARHQQAKRDKDRDLIQEQLLPIRRLLAQRKDPALKDALFAVFRTEFFRPLTHKERQS